MQALPTLFLKTINSWESSYKTLQSCVPGEPPANISFRAITDQDVMLIYRWVNEPYSRRFWQMNNYPPDKLKDILEESVNHPYRHILMGLYNERPVCEMDIYLIQDHELYLDIPEASAYDCGIHFLMAPPDESFKGLSGFMLRSFMELFFLYSSDGDLYAEPDEQNTLANRLAMNAGFRFIKKISLTDKVANLYCISRNEFFSKAVHKLNA